MCTHPARAIRSPYVAGVDAAGRRWYRGECDECGLPVVIAADGSVFVEEHGGSRQSIGAPRPKEYPA